MVFKCQEDSFLKEFTTTVLSCEKAEIKRKNAANKDETLTGYHVLLENTVLFPEGGGQPCDYGFINDKPVIDVKRRGAEALHFIESEEAPFQVGVTVDCKVDWDRRHDHMQQHSGQHLLSAVFERKYNINTLSWSLSADVSYIELDPNALISHEQIQNVETICNNAIAAATPVYTQILDPTATENSSIEITRATKGLPKDHVGDIRVITIKGIDSNMCCGTHVTNLAQLMCIKLLNIEKTKNRQFLHFLVGKRVLNRLQESFERECQINLIVNGGPSSHIDLIKKLQSNQKSNQRNLQKCIKEIAKFECDRLKSSEMLPKWICVTRNYGNESDFINSFLQNAPEVSEEGLQLMLITAGEDNSSKGQMTLFGIEAIVQETGPKICEILDGKGNGKGKRFQGKINNLKRLPECEKFLNEYFQKK